LDVVVRRSSDGLAIEDPLVAAAVRWIRANYASRLSVTTIASAVRSSRQRLERRFRKELGRTIVDEVRRARVEAARRLLWATQLALAEVACQCGFTNAAVFSVAFRREMGVPPGAYRRNARGSVPSEDSCETA
jgi:LacI family transcriptional regulator